MRVPRSTFYAHRGSEPSNRARENAELLKAIKVVFRCSRGRYGARRVWKELASSGRHCGRHRVARLMRRHGLQGRRPRRFVVTTDSKHDQAVAPNVLGRNFEAEAPNQKWTADITFIWTHQGWLYLAVVLDLYSRRVVGWAEGSKIDRRLTLSALQMALRRRRPA